MTRLILLSFVVATSSLAVGCNKGDTPSTAGSENGGSTKTTQEAPPTDPAARVAYDFLKAVLKGDEQQVTACLTPKAAEQLVRGDKRFPMPGIDSTTFQVGEVRKPSESQALVQCLLNDVSKDGAATREEICCLLRLADNQWRISGLAFGTSQGRPTILDFESPPPQPMGPPTTPAQAQVAPPQNSGRPSPQKTATETFSPTTIR